MSHDADQLLTLLAERRILLCGDGGRLQFRAPEGALDDSVRALLRTHKESLLACLRKRPGYLQLGPLSYNQLSLFFLNLLDPASAAYNLALTLRLQNPARVDTLQEALSRLARQHDQLRATFGHLDLAESSIPCSFTAIDLPPRIETFDARCWSDTVLRERAQAFYAAPIDLESGPVVHAGLFQGADGGDVLILRFHHIAVDGWSLGLLSRELARHHDAASAGRPSDVPTEPAAYIEHAVAQRHWLATPAGAGQVAWWKQKLQPAGPPADFGGSGKRPAVRRCIGSTRFFDIPGPTRARVEACAGRIGVTPFAFLLAVFQQFLLARSGHNEITVGVPTLGKRGTAFEQTVGYFVNPVAVRSLRREKLPFSSHARATAIELAEAIDHRELPFTALVEHLGGSRDPAYTPVFQVLFNLLNRRMLGDVVDMLYPADGRPALALAGSGLASTAFPLHQQEGQFDLTLEFVERGDGWLGLFKFCTDLFSDADAEGLVAGFNSLLGRVLEAPDTLQIGGAPAHSAPAAASGPETAPFQIAIAATFTAEAMQEGFEFWFERLGWSARTAFAPFNQVFQQLLDPASLLRTNARGFNIVCLRLDDLAEAPTRTTDAPEERAQRLQANIVELVSAFRTAAPQLKAPLCVAVCPSSPQLESAVPTEPALLSGLVASLASIPGLQVLDPATLAAWYPVADVHEPAGDEIGHIPYTPRYLAALSSGVVRMLHAIGRKPVKAIAVDCDGTLWEGVVGEDGPAGVVIGPAQREFQEFLVRQHRAGVVLCLCSKNREADVWAVFEQNPAMVLKREHVGFQRINWQSKSAGIRELAAEINISADSFAFIDDNVLEREEVRANCPEALCLDIPAAWEERMPYLRHCWPLDRTGVTEDDRKRAAHYRAEQLRTNLQQNAGSFSEFLDRLQLQVDIRAARPEDHERLAQLTIRTNQFNTTVRRMTAADLSGWVSNPAHAAWVVDVRDRFGDYGTVGAMLASKSDSVLCAEAFMLSCRALGRGVEHRMASRLAEHAAVNGCTSVEFPVQITPRNEPARGFLDELARRCSGTRTDDGTLGIDSSRLSGLSFSPATPPAPSSATESTTVQSLGTGNAVQVWEPRLLELARELQTAEAIASAMQHWREKRRGAVQLPRKSQAATTQRTETEQSIASAWKHVLAMPEVGSNENFFELGGTSLLLAQLALELRRRGFAVSIIDLFQHPTVGALARHLGGEAKPSAPSPRQTPPPGNPDRPLPSAFARLKAFRGR